MPLTSTSPSAAEVDTALHRIQGWQLFDSPFPEDAFRSHPRVGTITEALAFALRGEAIMGVSGRIAGKQADFSDCAGTIQVITDSGVYQVAFDDVKAVGDPIHVEWIPWVKVSGVRVQTTRNTWLDANDQSGWIVFSIDLESGDSAQFSAPHKPGHAEYEGLVELVDLAKSKIAS